MRRGRGEGSDDDLQRGEGGQRGRASPRRAAPLGGGTPGGTHLLSSSGPLTETSRKPHSVAAAPTTNVLPQPGGPYLRGYPHVSTRRYSQATPRYPAGEYSTVPRVLSAGSARGRAPSETRPHLRHDRPAARTPAGRQAGRQAWPDAQEHPRPQPERALHREARVVRGQLQRLEHRRAHFRQPACENAARARSRACVPAAAAAAKVSSPAPTRGPTARNARRSRRRGPRAPLTA